MLQLRIQAVFALGLAGAVLVDAIVGRMLLVPAVMRLFGAATWWPPRRLVALLPKGADGPIDAGAHDASPRGGEPRSPLSSEEGP